VASLVLGRDLADDGRGPDDQERRSAALERPEEDDVFDRSDLHVSEEDSGVGDESGQEVPLSVAQVDRPADGQDENEPGERIGGPEQARDDARGSVFVGIKGQRDDDRGERYAADEPSARQGDEFRIAEEGPGRP